MIKNNGKILVTGVMGFIGRSVAKHYVQNGWEVLGVGTNSWGREPLACESKIAPITNANLQELGFAPDVIFHAAGTGSVSLAEQNPLVEYERAIGSLVEVLTFASSLRRPPLLIFPSSVAVCGSAIEMPIAEDCTADPISNYGWHKKISESVCEMYRTQFGIPIQILRLFSVYGPGLEKQLLWDACQKFHAGENEFFGTGREVRDWVHIADLLQAVDLLAAQTLNLNFANQETANQTVNLGGGVPVTNKEILTLLAAEFGISEVRFSGESRPGDPTAYVADVSRLRSFGFAPEISLEAGVREYASWFKSQKK